MRYTGIAIALIGVAIAAFSGIIALIYGVPSDDAAVIHAERQAAPDLTFPLIISVGAIIAGLALYFFGGRGYAVTQRPESPPPAMQS